ncbi:MAG TPA: 16S rRNA (cytidine(1402)-2'-O)-methyltransferase [Clostridiales bacterium]|nr:16S rRNA (cytidine(1402)-2'-O)-methyltransferase [Clostridiales bacterium]
MSGTLYLCATPIGNLDDITIRVINTLKEVDLVAAEDTRHSMRLLNHFNINTPMTSYHEHNKIEKGKDLIKKLQDGINIALITDAGTPAISDPGEELVAMALDADVTVTSLPGPSACITALTLSGLPTRRFVFEAFLPSKKKELQGVLEELKNETRTIIIYEAPHRLKKTLKSLYESLGDRKTTIVRELTKRYETIIQTTLKEANSHYKDNEPRGEFVIIIKGKEYSDIENENIKKWESLDIEEHMQYYFDLGNDKKDSMKKVAKDRGLSKRDVYNSLIKKH